MGKCKVQIAFKCLLPPSVQAHLWRTYSLPIWPADMGPLKITHNKILIGFLKLSHSSPIPALYFLLGELPIEARLHLDILSLFYNIWNNPKTTIYKIAQYLLQMAADSSLTWAAHLRTIWLMHNLPNPLELMPSGSTWKKED